MGSLSQEASFQGKDSALANTAAASQDRLTGPGHQFDLLPRWPVLQARPALGHSIWKSHLVGYAETGTREPALNSRLYKKIHVISGWF